MIPDRTKTMPYFDVWRARILRVPTAMSLIRGLIVRLISETWWLVRGIARTSELAKMLRRRRGDDLHRRCDALNLGCPTSVANYY